MAAPDLTASSVYAERVAPARAASRAVSRQLFTEAIAAFEISADFAAATFGFLLAHAGASSLFAGLARHSSSHGVEGTAATLGLLMVVLMHREGGYGGGSGLLRIRDTERVLRISVQSLAILYAAGILIGCQAPAADLLTAVFLVPAFLTFERRIVFSMAGKAQRSANGPARAVIYGAANAGRRVASALLDSPRLGLHPAAVVDDGASDLPPSLPALGYRDRASVALSPGPITAGRLQSLQCDLLLIAGNHLSAQEYEAAVTAARQAECDVALSVECGNAAFDPDGFASLSRPRSLGRYEIAKRAADITFSSALLVALAPVLLTIAALVRLDSPGPALFIQKRVGRHGKLFDIFKFRTMATDAPKYSCSPRSSSDPRITRIGRILRRFNLDELPQLFNVVAGTMSLVGPRPEMSFITATYDARCRQRLQALPGITGLWQLSADRSFPIHENLEYDLYYLRHRGLFLDLAILAHTLMFAMTGGI